VRKLLLADESITVQRVIALTFAEQDIQIVSVSDGRQAMDQMAAQRPDIVLAGTSLPQVSGYDLARYMRSRPDLKDVPVLLLSGAFETVDNARLAESGANGILEKPVEPTVVIGRVKELLGLKSEDKPAAPAGRLLTPAAPQKKTPPATTPRAVTNTGGAASKWDQLRSDTGLEPDAKSVEDASSRQGYGHALDAAFDSLDQQLSSPLPVSGSGNGGAGHHKAPRNPAGPLGSAPADLDPRRGIKAPSLGEHSVNNPVYEVDEDWFDAQDTRARADAKAGRREGLAPDGSGGSDAPVYEVDEDWFREQDRARAARAGEQQRLAGEMGIHDVDVPAARSAGTAGDLGLDLPILPPQTPSGGSHVPLAAAPSPAVPQMPPPEIKIVTPEITPTMLDQIAARVAERLTAGAFGDQLRTAMTDVIRQTVDKAISDTVRPIVAETSERVVREVVAETSERVVREVVAETSERVVREVVTATAEHAVRDAVSQTTERVVREAVTQATERAVPDAVAQTTERVVRETVPAAAERVVREVVAQTSDRAVREVVSETSERLVREEIERIKSRSKR
jgi:CheY-like chemotaxis protein